MIPKEDKRISIPGINGGEPFNLMEREDLWRRVYNIRPEFFLDDEDNEVEEASELSENEPVDWSAEEYSIIYRYFDEDENMREIANSKDEYTYKYVRGVINKEKERREG